MAELLTEAKLLELIGADQDLMAILTLLGDLDLPDCWLAAGTVRNAIWNYLTGQPFFDTQTDVDVVFFDPARPYEDNQLIQDQLRTLAPVYHWEVKNQVYMHQHSPNTAPYTSSREAIGKYPETCTALAIRLTDEGLELFTPYGLDDVTSFTLRPTPHFQEDPERLAVYHKRLAKKKWSNRWPIKEGEL